MLGHCVILFLLLPNIHTVPKCTSVFRWVWSCSHPSIYVKRIEEIPFRNWWLVTVIAHEHECGGVCSRHFPEKNIVWKTIIDWVIGNFNLRGFSDINLVRDDAPFRLVISVIASEVITTHACARVFRYQFTAREMMHRFRLVITVQPTPFLSRKGS